ncbi:MAG: amidohydrolase [Synergistaceae bacterium]|jgi:aminobenzoyl-glutamate utilization protein B|nr:amidohydrolase [Synergistaceae bacterium]
MNKKEMYRYLDEISDVLTEASDKIWDYAETAFEEFKSVALLKDIMKRYCFRVEEKSGGIDTAFCAAKGESGPVVGILAEYDALSGLSQKAGASERSEAAPGGNGHGCGHNIFAGGSIGAAIAVAKYMEANSLPGVVKLFGCPGEEGGSGKAFMAREGVFKGLDVSFAWHPMSVNAILDMSALANYQVLYKFKGIASHAAAAPHRGRSALDAVELMNVGVNFLREHVIQEARIHYAITNSGGFSPNVVQPLAEVLYLIRAPKTPQVDEIYKRINKIAQGAAMMTETELEIQFVKACANIVPNKTLSKVMHDNLIEQDLPKYSPEELEFAAKIAGTVLPSESDLLRFMPFNASDARKCAKLLEGKSMCDIVLPFFENAPDALLPASSDVGDVSWNVPTAQVVTSCYAMGTPEHSWQLVSQGRTSLAHKGMMLAAKVMAGTAVDVMEKPDVIKRASDELASRLNGDSYRCAIPLDVKPRPISRL